MEEAMTREEILGRYKIDNHGIIRDPGKFESEMLYAPYFYDSSMESGADETVYDGDTPIDIFIITEEDLKEFPELGDTYAVGLSETGSGFVSLEHFSSEEELNEELEELEESEEEEE
jgi:hypothetical protein